VLRERGQGIGILVSKCPRETDASYSLQDPTEVSIYYIYTYNMTKSLSKLLTLMNIYIVNVSADQWNKLSKLSINNYSYPWFSRSWSSWSGWGSGSHCDHRHGTPKGAAAVTDDDA
jgi:hypothetical protein